MSGLEHIKVLWILDRRLLLSKYGLPFLKIELKNGLLCGNNAVKAFRGSTNNVVQEHPVVV